MKIIFFGTPDFVLPVLEALHKTYDSPREQSLVAVVTQPPRPVGRKQYMAFSPVDDWAHGKKAIQTITDLNVKKFPEADLGIVAAYGKIIPEGIIKKFKFGILNIHPSLLPKYRGASPIQTAIINGETETGVSIIKMDAEMDHGPIVSSFKEQILGDDTNETLRKRLFERSAQFLIDLIPSFVGGRVRLRQQEHDKASLTKIIQKEDGYIDLKKMDRYKAERFIRGMYPWPMAWTYVNVKEAEGDVKKRLKILKAHINSDTGHLIIDMVQLEGKNPVTFDEFKRGYPGNDLL